MPVAEYKSSRIVTVDDSGLSLPLPERRDYDVVELLLESSSGGDMFVEFGGADLDDSLPDNALGSINELVEVTAFDSATTYTVTIDGTDYDVDASALSTASDVAALLAAAIQAGEDAVGAEAAAQFISLTDEGFGVLPTISTSVAGGTGTITNSTQIEGYDGGHIRWLQQYESQDLHIPGNQTSRLAMIAESGASFDLVVRFKRAHEVEG